MSLGQRTSDRVAPGIACTTFGFAVYFRTLSPESFSVVSRRLRHGPWVKPQRRTDRIAVILRKGR